MIADLPKREINLLPDHRRDLRMMRVSLVRAGRLLRRIMFALLLIAGSVVVVGFLHLQSSLEREAFLAEAEGDDGNVAAQIQAANRTIDQIYSFSQSANAWSDDVVEVLRVVPATVKIELLAVDPGQQVLTVRGRAESRAAILELERGLQSVSWATSVEAPLQNLTTGPNPEFSFRVSRAVLEEEDELELVPEPHEQP